MGPPRHDRADGGEDQGRDSEHRRPERRPDWRPEDTPGTPRELLMPRGPDRHQRFHQQLTEGRLETITRSRIGVQLDLERQYRHSGHGDVARRLGLHHHLQDRGGWRQQHYCGPISRSYIGIHFGYDYCGPGLYPHRVWWPHWNHWVRWSWWDYCLPDYDPRPVYCRPIYYPVCSQVIVYETPSWQPLPIANSGTWVDVPAVTVAAQQYDLQLLAVRFVDAGHPESKLGPRYRVWLRNNSAHDLTTPFSVTLVAAEGERLTENLPQTGVRVESIGPSEIQAVDLRLPWQAYELSRDATGRPVPFTRLHIVVDGQSEIEETSTTNNGVVLGREEILPVDPAAFSTDADTVVVGQEISVAGEGFGPEPGKVLLYVSGLEWEPEIQGWYDLGVRVKIPELPLADLTAAKLVVVRGDSAASNPVEVTLAPTGTELLPAP